MLNISHLRNAYQNHNEIPLHIHQDGYNQNRQEEGLERMQRNWNPHTLLVGMQNRLATLENSLELLKMLNTELQYDSPLGIDHTFHLFKVYNSVVFHPQVYPRKLKTCHFMKETMSNNNLYMKVHSSITHNSKNVETTQMSIS